MMHPYASEPIAVSTTGSIAFQILSEARSGRVAAVFERCFYADFNGLFVCFGGAEIGNGPLNALVDGQWRDIGLRVGDVALALEELSEAHVRILSQPVREESGPTYAYVAAPDGVVIELTQYASGSA